MKHTPGPWRYAKTENGKYSIHSWGPLAYCAGESDYGDRALSNARLIAAAPELLAALQAIVHPMAGDEAMDDARALLASLA